MPKLSVIVPVYNTERYLRECIDSILAQTFADFELILVDDGSTDGSGAICDEYAGRDLRVRVIHQENGGVTRARKAAMKMAAGSWISFVDSDDWIHPGMLEMMLEKASVSNARIVICDASIVFPDRLEIAGSLAEEGFYSKEAMIEKIYPTMIMNLEHRRPGIAGWLCNKLFEKTLLETVFWNVDDSYIYSEDALCSYMALLECRELYILRVPLYYYRQHPASAVHQYNNMRYKKALCAYYAYEGFLKNRGFDISDQINAFISVNAVDIIRNVLLFDRQTPVPTRLKEARQFASDGLVQAALSSNIEKLSGSRNRWKGMLVRKRHIVLLYLLFALRQCMLEKIGRNPI